MRERQKREIETETHTHRQTQRETSFKISLNRTNNQKKKKNGGRQTAQIKMSEDLNLYSMRSASESTRLDKSETCRTVYLKSNIRPGYVR